jgi:hypothetical protein
MSKIIRHIIGAATLIKYGARRIRIYIEEVPEI